MGSREWEVEQTELKVGQIARFQGLKVRVEYIVNQAVALVRSLDNLKQKLFEVAIIHLKTVSN